MKREDYVKKATARIFDDRQKRAVSAELEDHIAHRTAALEEIGYDPERAEAQGVEAMGDPAEICDQLGALHNRFYTPVWDIVLLLLWGGLLAGAYFALDGEMRCSLPLMKTPYERPKMPRYWW